MKWFLFCVAILCGTSALAEFQVPALSGPVVDQVGLIKKSDRRDLEQLLRDYNQKGVAQLQVVILDTLGNEVIESASIKITDAWKLGNDKKDNGILFLIAPRERKMRIEVGQGLEGALTDLQSRRILDDIVRPYFRSQNYSTGVVAGVYEILSAVDKEFASQHEMQQEGRPGLRDYLHILVFGGFLLMMLILPRVGGGRGGRRGLYGGGGFGGGFGGSGWGGGSGGGWSGGGGGFSGGGASSGW